MMAITTRSREEAVADMAYPSGVLRETVGVFHDPHPMQEAIRELELSGFDRRRMSVIGHEKAVKARYGEPAPNRVLEDDPNAARAMPMKPEEDGLRQAALVGGGLYVGVVATLLASGWFLLPGAVVTTALLGGAGGAAIGGVLARYLGHRRARELHRQMERGGLVLWVQTPDEESESMARDILARYHAEDIHTHEISAEAMT